MDRFQKKSLWTSDGFVTAPLNVPRIHLDHLLKGYVDGDHGRSLPLIADDLLTFHDSPVPPEHSAGYGGIERVTRIPGPQTSGPRLPAPGPVRRAPGASRWTMRRPTVASFGCMTSRDNSRNAMFSVGKVPSRTSPIRPNTAGFKEKDRY